ncbi:hypothetical protein QQ045_029366 [Rhodiola kirilowii]
MSFFHIRTQLGKAAIFYFSIIVIKWMHYVSSFVCTQLMGIVSGSLRKLCRLQRTIHKHVKMEVNELTRDPQNDVDKRQMTPAACMAAWVCHAQRMAAVSIMC